MENIIPKVPTELIEAELTKERFLRYTNRLNNEIYIVNAFNAPNTMREIGRLREIAFRSAGGGTGLACDIDEFDTMENPCQQLIVWNPQDKAIIGGYRYILGTDIVVKNGVPNIATSHLFNFSDKFLEEFLPQTIELGRSFVTLEYQSANASAQAIYSLDNLWDGLGALIINYPDMKYFFGKFTMYPGFCSECRDMILGFLKTYFKDKDKLVTPITPLETNSDSEEILSCYKGDIFKEDYRTLNTFVRNHGFNIPPLVNAYMGLSPTMKFFGTAINYEFGDVEESGILISIDEISDNKKRRHIETFRPE